MAENENLNQEVNEEVEQTEEINEQASQAPVDEQPLDVDGDDDEITRLQSELDAAEEKYLRLYAEFENYKKRTRAELDTERAYRSQSVLRDIIPTIDNIERALQQGGDENDALFKGVKMVHEGLVSALKEHGLETIEAADVPFNPNFHQAVMQESVPDKESGIVLEELQKGYKLKERVLRPSMVKVNE